MTGIPTAAAKPLFDLCRRLDIDTSRWTHAATEMLRAVAVPHARQDGRWRVVVQIQPQTVDASWDLFGQIVEVHGQPFVRGVVGPGGRFELDPLGAGTYAVVATNRWATGAIVRAMEGAADGNAAEAPGGGVLVGAADLDQAGVTVAGIRVTQRPARDRTIIRVVTDRAALNGATVRLQFVGRDTGRVEASVDLVLTPETIVSGQADARQQWGEEWNGDPKLPHDCDLVIEVLPED